MDYDERPIMKMTVRLWILGALVMTCSPVFATDYLTTKPSTLGRDAVFYVKNQARKLQLSETLYLMKSNPKAAYHIKAAHRHNVMFWVSVTSLVVPITNIVYQYEYKRYQKSIINNDMLGLGLISIVFSLYFNKRYHQHLYTAVDAYNQALRNQRGMSLQFRGPDWDIDAQSYRVGMWLPF
jgi:hypothetical protein